MKSNRSLIFIAVILPLITVEAHAQNDVGSYGVQKIINYDQTSGSTPILDAQDPYSFLSYVSSGSSGALFANATLTPPAGSTGTVSYVVGSQGLNFFEGFPSKAALDAAFLKNGTYNLVVQTTTPNNYADQLSFGTDNYPAIPQITAVNGTTPAWNAAGALVLDPTVDNTITWSNPGGNNNAYFQINNANISSNGTPISTSYKINSGSLQNNLYYQATIQIINNGTNSTNSNTIPGAGGGINFQTQVSFTIQTGTPTSSSTIYNKVLKTHVLVQTSASGPVDATGDANNFTPAPYSASISDTVSATVTGPSSTSFPLAYTPGGGNNNNADYESSSGAVASASLLNSAYPDGTYTFPTAPAQTVSLTGDGYPAAPSITDVNGNAPVWDAQGHLVLDPTIPNTITWSSVTVPNFSTNGFEMAHFASDYSSFQSIKLQAGATTGNGTPILHLPIGAGTMTAGSTYTGRIDYIAAPSVPGNPSPNVYYLGGYRTETEFSVIAKYPTGLLQAITFPAIANQIAGAAPFTISATASSALPVTFSRVSGPVTLSGTNNSTVTLTGSGTVVIQASQAGNGLYAAAANTTQTFTIATQVITFPALNPQQVAGTFVTLDATASSGLGVTYQVSGPATLSGVGNNILTFTGTGTVTVEADQTGNGSYGAATPVIQTLNVNAATDVSYFSIQKAILYDQTAANTTALDLRKPYQFSSNIQGGNTGTVLSSSSLTPPTPSTGIVSYQNEGGGQNGMYFDEGFTTQSALDAAFASGTYNFTIQTDTPNTYTTPLTLGAANYPAIPQISSVTYGPSNTLATWSNGMAQIPDNTKSITVTWNNPSGTNDAFFQINNTGINSNNTPISNTYTIGANALPNNNAIYQGTISLTNGNGSSSSIPGVSSQASYQTQVAFYLQVGTPSVSSGLYEVQKTHVLVQSSNSTPSDGSGDLNGYDPAPYDLYIAGLVPGTATGPASTSYPLTSNGSSSKFRYRSGAFTSSANLDSVAPDGTYTFPGSGGSVSLSGTGAGNGYSTPAQILLVNGLTPVWDAEGQLVLDPSVPNTITWTSVPVNLTTNGHESAELSASGGSTLVQQQAGVTQSSTTAFTQLQIPTGTMTLTNTYVGDIDYFQASSFNTLVAGTTYAGAGYQTETYFTVVALKPQTMTFGAIPNQVLSSGTYTLGATASSGLPVTYSVAGPATLNDNVITFTGTGTVTVVASQIGNGTYASVPSITRSFTITNPPVLSFTQWESQPGYFNSTQMLDPTISGASAIPQHDGVPNDIKYLYNINPARTMTSADRAAFPVLEVKPNGVLSLTFRAYASLDPNSLAFAVQDSSNLQSWLALTESQTLTSSTYTIQPSGAVDANTGDPYMEIDVQSNGTNKQFLRLQVTSP